MMQAIHGRESRLDAADETGDEMTCNGNHLLIVLLNDSYIDSESGRD